jgi:ankyrin repeat protein
MFKMEQYNDTISKLAVIANLGEGDTLSPSYDQVVKHNSWSTTFWRTYNRETRKKTIDYIKDVFTNAVDMYKSGYVNSSALKDAICKALVGFTHLKQTYNTDFDIIGHIETICNEVSASVNFCYKNGSDDYFNYLLTKQYDFIEKYLYDGYPGNVLNNLGQNAFHIICNKQYYDAKILNLLYNFNVDPFFKDFQGFTPLDIAIDTGCAEAVIFLETIDKKKQNDLI